MLVETPVVITCGLCPNPDDGAIVTLHSRAWTVAMDHALDHHAAELIADPALAERSFTITEDADPKPLRGRVCHARVRLPRRAA